jgi:hypothetical protein
VRVRVAEPSPQVVDHVAQADQALHDASTTAIESASNVLLELSVSM